MARAYESTTVEVERSQGDIRKLLTEHGATSFAFGEETVSGRRWAALSFGYETRAVRMRVPHKDPDEEVIERKAKAARTKTSVELRSEAVEQEAKRIWRVIAWNLKARLVSVDEGVETFDEAFLAHLLDRRTGQTVYEQLLRDGEVSMEGGFEPPQLTSG